MSDRGRVPLRQVAGDGATAGQVPGWDNVNGLWVPGDVVRTIASSDGSVTVDDTDPQNIDLTVVGGGGGGSLTVQDENGNVATGVTQLDFQGAGVTATPGTGEVIVTIPGGGGGAASPYPLDPTSLNPTYGDHFTGPPDARWNRVGYVAADEQYAMGGGTWLQVDTPRGAANYYYQAAPAGDFTVVMKAILVKPITVMWGPLILDSSGNGVGAITYDNPDSVLVIPVSAGSYGGTYQNRAGPIHAAASVGLPIWYRLNKTGTAYKASASTNGVIWRAWTPTITFATTPTRIGFGGTIGTSNQFAVDFFDVQ